jgi:short-subunit dehydrogenase
LNDRQDERNPMATEDRRQLAVITGASSGIGFEFAKVFGEERR